MLPLTPRGGAEPIATCYLQPVQRCRTEHLVFASARAAVQNRALSARHRKRGLQSGALSARKVFEKCRVPAVEGTLCSTPPGGVAESTAKCSTSQPRGCCARAAVRSRALGARLRQRGGTELSIFIGDIWMWLQLLRLQFELDRGPVGIVWG